MSLWFHFYVSVALLILTLVACYYFTRYGIVPLIREVIAIAQKRQLAKQQKTRN